MAYWYLLYYLIITIVSYAISYASMPKPQTNNPTAGELDTPTAEAGKGIPVVFGTIVIKDSNVIDYFDAKTDAIKSGGGGKK